ATPRLERDVARVTRTITTPDFSDQSVEALLLDVLAVPAVADKSFLIHIGDRSVGGYTARDQLVGRWQVPVADVAVTTASHQTTAGEAMAMGERTPVAAEAPAAAARLAIAEAVTNIIAADIDAIGDIKLSANWMAAAGQPGEDAALFDAVTAVGLELCPALGIAVPVGKDSLSMQTRWDSEGEAHTVTAPVSLIVTAFAPVGDVRRTLTPELQPAPDSHLVFVDLARDPDALGRSALAQATAQQGGTPADLSDPAALKGLVTALAALRAAGNVLAYHDRGDGGLAVTLAEMMFASRIGIYANLPADGVSDVGWLFNEGPGALLQVRDVEAAMAALTAHGCGDCATVLGGLRDDDRLVIERDGVTLVDKPRRDLQLRWSEMSFRMQALRDNPTTAAEAYETIADDQDPGLQAIVPFGLKDNIAAPYLNTGVRPRVAVLRDQGVNSQYEMAAAFIAAGFDAVDVHMSDLELGRTQLSDFQVLAACGGFSYGDVLGAGGGWAKSIRHVAVLRDAFAAFLSHTDTLALGVCNGCQMLAQLADLVPGSEHWPRFHANRSAQFEARLSQVQIGRTNSPWFAGMAGATLPVVVSHGEGRAVFSDATGASDCPVVARYVDGRGRVAERYPANPNGSTGGIAMLTNADGRVAISMPHPERTARTVQHSWHPPEWGEDGPWTRLFRNARVALG
ncbi:MAG: phosphoribosylformylglycinamidine synthase, partial [Pseudomonadota bacterium]